MHAQWRLPHGTHAPPPLRSPHALHAPPSTRGSVTPSGSSSTVRSSHGSRASGYGQQSSSQGHVGHGGRVRLMRHRPLAAPGQRVAKDTPCRRHPGAAGAAAAAAATADVAAVAGNSKARAARLAAPVVIVGGGPGGLAAALMLARRGYTNVKVYERLAEPPAPDDASVWGNFEQASERLYMIGLNGRGQAVLRGLGVMDIIDSASSRVLGRMDWQPGSERSGSSGGDGSGSSGSTGSTSSSSSSSSASSIPGNPRLSYYGSSRSYQTRCLQRDRLASCLLRALQQQHADAVSVTFGARCVHAEWSHAPGAGGNGDGEMCRLTFQMQQPAAGTDGSSSSRSGGSTGDATGTSISVVNNTSTSGGGDRQVVEESAFVIGADGAASALRAAMEEAAAASGSSSTHFRVTRFANKNEIVYRTIPLFWPDEELGDDAAAAAATAAAAASPAAAGGSTASTSSSTSSSATGGSGSRTRRRKWPLDVNYSSRTKAGISLDCLPTREGPYIGVMLYKPGEPRIAALKTADDVRSLFQDLFPAFLPAVREVDLARFAAKGDSSLPTFSYAGPALHHGRTTCLLGDAIHTVKPYFGQGVNSCFEDVAVLERALDETSDGTAAHAQGVQGSGTSSAVQRYTELRAADAEALVKLSHSLDGGFLTFVGPLILDSLLHRLAPALFSPNIIASLQNEQWSFSRIRARKRVDRALQVLLLGGLAAAVVRIVGALLAWVSKLVLAARVA